MLNIIRMGVCCDNLGVKKLKIKVKRKKKRKTKDAKEEMSFNITDVNQNKSNQIFTKTNLTLRELLTLAEFNLNGDFDVQLENSENINEDLNTNLKDIIEKYFPDKTLITLSLFVIYKGLSIPSNIKKAYEEMTPIIGSAIFDDENKFGFSLYDKVKRNLNTYYFDKSKNENIKKFNLYSAYCSAKGVFYISGGEIESEINSGKKGEVNMEFYGNFIGIDMNKIKINSIYNKSSKIETVNENESENDKDNDELSLLSNNEISIPVKKLPRLNVERSWHSMIFIPNKYIFIVGGTNTKTVERYDIEKNELKYDSELKEKRCEPALCLVNNNYLYAFYGFIPFKDFNNNIERCDLLKKRREWEIICCSTSIIASFFGISFYKDNEILLISPKDNIDDENKNYIVKIGNDDDSPDEIKETILPYNGIRTFKDKLFYPMFDNYCVNIPMNFGKNKTVLILDCNTGNIECKNY